MNSPCFGILKPLSKTFGNVWKRVDGFIKFKRALNKAEGLFFFQTHTEMEGGDSDVLND
jgi:hypothetical protein